MSGGSHWDDPLPPSVVDRLQDMSGQLLNLLRAAVHLLDPFACAESGPLEAVLKASLVQAEALDDLVNEIGEDAAA